MRRCAGQGDGRMPSPGWDDRYDWKGRIPFAQLPYDYNPPSGFIVAANQQIIGRPVPLSAGLDFSYGWRSQQLIDRLRYRRRSRPTAPNSFSTTTPSESRPTWFRPC